MIMKQPLRMILLAAAVTVALLSCRRGAPAFVEPTGWVSLSPAADSLTRAIELSFQNGAGADSTLSLMEKFRGNVPEGMEDEALSRLLYWQGRIEIRDLNRELGHRLLDSAYITASGATKEYIGRMNEWRRENQADFSVTEWYARKLAQAEYFKSRDDWQMLYNVYRELMELMRDIGLNSRALYFLDRITECNMRIDPKMALLDDKMNRAAILSDIGADSTAIRLNRELQADPEYMREPVNVQLVNMNLCNLAGDTAALHAAYGSILRHGDRADLLPKVYFYLVDEAIRSGNRHAADRWSDSLGSILPQIGVGTTKMKALKAISAAREMSGDTQAALSAYREYVITADSVTALLRDDSVANLELSHAIEEYDVQMERERKSAAFRMWLAVGTAIVLVLAAVWMVVRWRRKTRILCSETEKIKDETEHRRLALQLDAERRGLVSEIGTDDFITLFSQRYPFFIGRLRSMAPRISDTALRLAGYISIGLSTKEIADLMNVRPESVRQGKWRLRKTLRLKSEEDLFPLLSSLLKGEP